MAATMTEKQALFGELNTFLSELGTIKAAATKKKADDPGSIGGTTESPTKSVEDGTQNATEGAQASANNSILSEQTPAPNTTNATDTTAKPGTDINQTQIGTTKSKTGEDPKTEGAAGSLPDDPGTEHPAKADVGPKFSSAKEAMAKYASMSFGDLAKEADRLGNALLTSLSAAAISAPAASPTKTAQAQPASTPAELQQAAEAGYELAKAAGINIQDPQAVKQAVDGLVVDYVEQVLRDADRAADLVGMAIRESHAKKAAAEEAAKKAAGAKKAEDAPPEEKKDPPEESSSESDSSGSDSGTPPMPAGGGGPGGAPGGDMGGGGGPSDDELNELLMALIESGKLPPEVLALLQQGGGAGGPPPDMGGGMPPMGGGGPGGPPPDMGGGMPPMGGPPPDMAGKMAQQRSKMANMVKAAMAYQKAGKFRFEEAKTAERRQLRDRLKHAIVDMCGTRR